jgi:chromate transporter
VSKSEPEVAISHDISLREAFWVWVKIAINSFGGPAGQISVMHRVLVEEKKWISENRFLYALNYCMFLPGPEAQQLAIYIGWLLHRVKGGLTAGILFVLPGLVSITGLSMLYASFQNVGYVQALFYGLKPAVMAVVVEAVIRIGKRALKNNYMIVISVISFISIFFLNIPFPLIIFGAALVGFIGGKFWPDRFQVIRGQVADSDSRTAISDDQISPIKPTLRRAIQVTSIALVAWGGPIVALIAILGSEHVLVRESIFFSQTSVVTFGGAYAVLAYVSQQAVEVFGWLQPGEMLDGLGMAETTPGPLVSVLNFVGFLGAYRNPAPFGAIAAGTLGALVVAWVTYVPCFLWIFLGAPYMERLRGNAILSSALSGITAAVVGVILNLALWFSIHTLFGVVDEINWNGLRLLIPDFGTLDVASFIIAIGAFVALLRFKLNMMLVLFGSALVGLVYYMLVLN